jgi:hypothetical protein
MEPNALLRGFIFYVNIGIFLGTSEKFLNIATRRTNYMPMVDNMRSLDILKHVIYFVISTIMCGIAFGIASYLQISFESRDIYRFWYVLFWIRIYI